MEEENINKNNKPDDSIKKFFIVLGFLVILLIIIIFIAYFKGIGKGYFVYEGVGGKYRIDIVKFSNMTDYYIHTESNGKQYIYPFRNSPRNLEKIYLEPNIKNLIINKEKVYVTQNNKELGAKSLIGKIEFVKILGTRDDLGGLYNLDIEPAFTTSVENLTIASCSNVNSNIGVIFLKLGEENKIYSDKGCVIIEGKNDDGLLLSSEKFAYHLLEVF